MSNQRFRQSIQIGDNVTDIMKLPCVIACKKKNDKNGFEWLEYRVRCGKDGHIEHVEESDWLCETYEGYWLAMSDDHYDNLIETSE